MICVTLLSLLALAWAADFPQYPPPSGGYGPSITDVDHLVRTLEEDFKELQTNVGSATTLCAVGAERLSFIRGKKITALDLKDLQQNALIDLFKGEVKEMQHRADAAQALVDGAKKRATDTREEINSLSFQLSGVSSTNNQQNDRIKNLTDEIKRDKDYIIGNINGSISFLQSELHNVRNKVEIVHQFLESRNCEYGFFALHLDSDSSSKRINFQTKFDKTPQVAVSTVGFSAHLDVEKYGTPHEYDVLAIDKFVGAYADAFGFEAKAIDNSKGKVDVKTIYCSYMACQNIDQSFQLPH